MAARRRRAPLVGLLLVVLVLAGLCLVADRVLLGVVERRAAEQLQTRLGTPDRPTVQIEGFPFLTQVARGTFRQVHVVADQVRVPEQDAIPLAHLDLDLSDVSSADGWQSATAAAVGGSATVDYTAAQTLTGRTLSHASGDQVLVTVPTELLGLQVTAKVVGRPLVQVEEQTLTLTDARVSVAGIDLPASTSQALLNRVLKPAAITGVPYGLTVSGITAQPEGLVTALTGQDITFTP